MLARRSRGPQTDFAATPMSHDAPASSPIVSPSSPRPGYDGPRAWQAVVYPALAGAMGWGIRGQYGHETGAMIAGVLVGLVLVLLFCRRSMSIPAARAVAFCTVAMGIGGSMTYGQTIGLTQNADLVGNWEAWRWGMLGLAIKGAIWIGFAGLFLGMGLGGVRYSWRRLAVMVAGLACACVTGWWLLNTPFDPAQRILPRLSFSASWHWQPGAGDALKPRSEVWGGLLFALAFGWAWAGWWQGDRLARRLAVWGMLGGLGFPIGQSLQSFHAWRPDVFQAGLWATLDPAMNWWNWMETTFGAVMGACLGLGAWRNRGLIAPLDAPPVVEFAPAVEWTLAGVHVTLLVLAEFTAIAWVGALYDPGLALAAIPFVAVAGGRWWPFLVTLPITALPIAGKTIRSLVYQAHAVPPPIGWLLSGVVPLLLTLSVAAWFARRAAADSSAIPSHESAGTVRPSVATSSHASPDAGGHAFARVSLLLLAWLYFGLNYAIFRFPWPWEPWTTRTPTALAFAVCLAGLTVLCVRSRPDRVA